MVIDAFVNGTLEEAGNAMSSTSVALKVEEIDLFDRLARRIRVYGKRWWGLGKMNLTFVENWVRPSAAETPAGASAVEGGTYW